MTPLSTRGPPNTRRGIAANPHAHAAEAPGPPVGRRRRLPPLPLAAEATCPGRALTLTPGHPGDTGTWSSSTLTPLADRTDGFEAMTWSDARVTLGDVYAVNSYTPKT